MFVPRLLDLYLTLAGCGIGIGLMIFLAVRAGKKAGGDPRRRVLLPMLAYFTALLFLMAFLGAFWTTFKYPTVMIGEAGMVIDDETYAIPSLTNIRTETVGRGLNTTQTVLLVQTRDRRNWAFPEDRYDIRRMLGLLRQHQR